MRFLHLADLHFGKSIHGISLLDSGDQRHWVDRFLELAAEVKPDAVVIAGDVYDRSAPSGDAVQLLSDMLTALAEREIPVMLVAGNHDSVQRLSFASALLSRQGLHISSDLFKSHRLERVTLEDEHGPVTFWLMPYVFPGLVEQALGLEGLRDYDAAARALLAAQGVDFAGRNVLIAHQNVTANGVEVERGGSESMIGGVGQVDYTAFDGFDYVALGHIHSSYAVGRDAVRYAGSPLCYHFDETRQPAKGPLLVELGEKGTPARIESLRIPPLHPMRVIRGAFDDIMAGGSADGAYVSVALTDRRVGHREAEALRAMFSAGGSRLLELKSEYAYGTEHAAAPNADILKRRQVEDLFADFYAARTGEAPDENTAALLTLAGERLRNARDAEPTEEDVDRLLDLLMEQEGRP